MIKSAVVTMLFNNTADQVLLIRRNHPPFAHCWNGIGGKLQPGETPLDATIRECQEETGITPPHPKLLCTITYPGGKVSSCLNLHVTYDFVDDSITELPIPDDAEGHYEWHPISSIMDARDTTIAGYSNLNQFVKEIFALESIDKFYPRFQPRLSYSCYNKLVSISKQTYATPT